MEAILVPPPPSDQSISPFKPARKLRKKNRPSETTYAGVLHPPPPPSLSISLPPSAAPHFDTSFHRRRQIHLGQPSLHPLPLPPRPHREIIPPANRKINRSRSQSLSPGMSKPPINAKRPDLRKSFTAGSTDSAAGRSVTGSLDRIGPDPSDLPKDVSRVLSSFPLSNSDVEGSKFSGSALTDVSPHPSSLPLPKFSVRRPKLSCCCKAAVAGVDAGATDNLCRILRLR